MMKPYSSPELNIVLIGQKDVLCVSPMDIEAKDVMNEDIGEWY